MTAVNACGDGRKLHQRRKPEHMAQTEIARFVEELGAIQAGPNTFNPWNTETAAGAVCRHNLSLYLHTLFQRDVRIMLLGEAPGYQGCRLTGISFTSEALLVAGVPTLDILGESGGYRRVPSDFRLSKEPSATIVWSTLAEFGVLPVLWPAFPFHPHRPGDPRSNRPPTSAEVRFGLPIWRRLALVMNISTFVAVGNVGHASLAAGGIDAPKLRHPSHGGKPQFVQGIRALVETLQTSSESRPRHPGKFD
ncbi:MAG: uracil-DNA glycosylase [Thermomicrobiales bacterium]